MMDFNTKIYWFDDRDQVQQCTIREIFNKLNRDDE